jgi:hypothetical protein
MESDAELNLQVLQNPCEVLLKTVSVIAALYAQYMHHMPLILPIL